MILFLILQTGHPCMQPGSPKKAGTFTTAALANHGLARCEAPCIFDRADNAVLHPCQ